MVEHLSRDEAYDFVSKAQERRQVARDSHDEKAQVEAAVDCGIGHFYMGDVRLAMRLFDEARQLIGKTGARKELLPTAIGMKGRALQKMDRGSEALESYREAAQAARETNLGIEQLRWRGREAKTLMAMRDPEGLRMLEESIASGRALLESGDTAAAAELAAQLMAQAAALETTDRARSESSWNEVFDLLRPLPASRSHYLASNNFATSLHKWGLDHQAQTYIEEALEIGGAIGADPAELIVAVHRYAEMAARLYGNEMAGDWLVKQAPTLLRHQWEIFEHAVNLYERGFFWARMKAATIGWRALKIPTPIYPPLFQMALRYSFACRGLGELDEALAALEEAGRYAKELTDPAGLIVRVQTMLVLVDRGDVSDAAARAGELWNEGNRDRLVARAFVDALIGIGDTARAAQVVDDFTRHGGGAVDGAWMAGRLAEAGNGDPLEKWYDYGRIAHRERNTESELDALNRLIALYAPASDENFEACRQRLRLIDKVRSNVTDFFADSAWFSVTPNATSFPAYLDGFLESALARGDHQSAVYELERFRSQMLVDLLAERRARWRGSVPEAFQARIFITNTYDRARYAYQGLVARGAGWQARRAAAKELDQLKAMTAGAGGIIHVAPGWQGFYFPRTYQQFFEEVHLGQGEALVFQHVFGDRTVFWMMDASQAIHSIEVRAFTRDVQARIQTLFGSYLRESSRGTRDLGEPRRVDAGAALDELDAVLAQPLMEWVKTFPIRRVFMVAGTSAGLQPLSACRSVIEARIELAVLPTSRALAFVRQPRTPPIELFHPVNLFEYSNDFAAARERVVLVVDPTQSLVYAPWEAAAVELAAEGRRVEAFDEDAVDIPHFSRAARTADVLHMIVHGIFDDASPFRSGVYIRGSEAADQLWTVADVFSQLDAPAGRVAVLSGCETGLSRPNLVSEEVSLPSALIAAGFAAVVATNWAVDDLSTALLMSEFYRRWYRGGVTLCHALAGSAGWLKTLDRAGVRTSIERLENSLAGAGRDAKRAGWDALVARAAASIDAAPDRPFEAPYYWAPFFVEGDGAIVADGVDSRDPAVAGLGRQS
jgi:tetratricopeptide (TPR) repeat protein